MLSSDAMNNLSPGDELSLTVTEEDAGLRVDKWLSNQLTDLSRNRIQLLLASGDITRADGKLLEPKQRVKPGETYLITMPEPEPSQLTPCPMKLDIIYEDEDVLVINKPPSLTVHPGNGTGQDTLANGLVHYFGENLSQTGGHLRPGIVHRLDRDTSGLMLVAKNDKAHLALAEQLRDRTLHRFYHALVWGAPQPRSGTITTQLNRSRRDRTKMQVTQTGGKQAITHYTTLETYHNAASLVECKLQTGRTHQIRVHMEHRKTPIIGDPSYGKPPERCLRALPEPLASRVKPLSRQMLHAKEIAFLHPRSGQKLSFTEAPPDDMNNLLGLFREWKQ